MAVLELMPQLSRVNRLRLGVVHSVDAEESAQQGLVARDGIVEAGQDPAESAACPVMTASFFESRERDVIEVDVDISIRRRYPLPITKDANQFPLNEEENY